MLDIRYSRLKTQEVFTPPRAVIVGVDQIGCETFPGNAVEDLHVGVAGCGAVSLGENGD